MIGVIINGLIIQYVPQSGLGELTLKTINAMIANAIDAPKSILLNTDLMLM